MFKRLIQFAILGAFVAAAWWWLSSREAIRLPEDRTEISYHAEQRVQEFLRRLEEVPIHQQSRTEVTDGRQYVLFYKKIRAKKNVSLPEISRAWEAFAAASGLRLREVRFHKETQPRGNIMDLVLGTEEIATHHIIYTQSQLPQLVIIVDDVGYSGGELLRRLVRLPAPLNIAIIPGTPSGKADAEVAHRHGHEVLLHLPMEPINRHWRNPEPWGISEMLDDAKIMRTVELDLEWVPHVAAVNNHMGSRSTADRRIMKNVLSVIKKHGLLFVDSGTTPQSVVGEVAKEMHLNILKRDLFLDAVLQEAYTKAQLNELVRIARKRGYAVGICHIRRSTVAALEKNLANLLTREGVELVRATDLVR